MSRNMSDRPIKDEKYYFADYSTGEGFFANSYEWSGDTLDNNLYNRGLIRLSEINAVVLVSQLNEAIGAVLRPTPIQKEAT